MKQQANITKVTENTGEIPDLLPRGFSAREFAKQIGVSHTTVYNVINGVESKVGPDTRQMVINELWKLVEERQPAPAA